MDESDLQQQTHVEDSEQLVSPPSFSPTKNSSKIHWQKLLLNANSSELYIKKIVPNPTQSHPTYNEEKIILSPALQNKMVIFLQKHNLHVETLCQAVWGYLVSIYSNHDDIVFGSAKIKFSLVLDKIPVKIKIQLNDTVITYLNNLQQQLSASNQSKHSIFGNTQIRNKTLKENDFFDTVFLFRNDKPNENATNLSGNSFRFIDIPADENIHYSLAVMTQDLISWIKIRFDETLYAQIDIQKLLNHFLLLLESFVDYPQKHLKNIYLLTPDEQKKILFDWNQTKSEYIKSRSIQQVFEDQAKKLPNEIAIFFKDRTITYHELNAKANQFARYLRALGVTPNTAVAISLETLPELIICILDILKSGGTYVPLDPHYPKEQLKFMLEDTQAKILLTHSAVVGHFENTNTKLVCIDTNESEMEIAKHTNTNLNDVNNSDDLAYIIYTSGSTGKPKGVMVTHGNVNHFCHWFSKALAITHQEIVDFSSSISFDFSVANTLFPLTQGSKIALYPEIYKNEHHLYIQHLLKNKVNIIKLTPSRFRQLKEFIETEHQFKDLRFIVFGREPIYKSDLKDWLKQFPHHQIFVEYGPTEATVATSWLIVNINNIDHFENNIPIGKAALNSQLYILNKHLQPLPVRMIGKLYIGGGGVAKGYLNRPEITGDKFIPNPFAGGRLYKTGDLCRYLPDGNIEFIGRVDHQIKIRGFRVEIDEVQNCLLSHSAIKEAIVIAQDSPGEQLGEKRLIAYFIPINPQTIPSNGELHQYMQHRLPDYMVPDFYVMLTAFPLSPNGKLDRKALPEPILDIHHAIKPRNELELLIKRIWSDALNLKEISIDDNFFELGGHSLSAARIISKIRKITKKEIKLDHLYKHPTISELACSVSQEINMIEESSIKNSRQNTPKQIPLSDMQLLFWLAEKTYTKSIGLNITERIRLAGKINIHALNSAFQHILQKHPILTYHVSNYFPYQFTQEKTNYNILEANLINLQPKEMEAELLSSLQNLKRCHLWKKGSPLIVMKVFYLDSDLSELQICIAHIISDEISPQIIFNDLSAYYLMHKNNLPLNLQNSEHAFLNYIDHEKNHFDINLPRDINFWENYLHGASGFVLPCEQIIKINTNQNHSYSSQIKLPATFIERLQEFGIENRLNVTNSLCAAIGLAMLAYTEKSTHKDHKTLAINFVKSTRDNDAYDNAIGFFIKTDLIRMKISAKDNFLDLCKQIQKSTAESAPYQFCPNIVKFTYFYKHHWMKKKISNFILKILARCLTTIFYKLKLNSHILLMYFKTAISIGRQDFLVELNVMNNFLNNSTNKNLFGFQILNLQPLKVDRIIANNVIDITFGKDNQNHPFLIVSGNVQADFRERIGRKIIKIMETNLPN